MRHMAHTSLAMNQNLKKKTKRLDITDRTVMLSVDFHRIGNSRRLPKGDFSVDADKSMVRANKQLLKSAELKAISRFDGQVRDYIATRALPSMFKGGFWVVPIDLLEQLDAKLTEFAAERQPLVDGFVEAYPGLMEAAKESLRGIYRESDYMSEDQVREEFKFSWRYVSFGVPEQLEAIKESIFEREKEKAIAHWESATSEVQNLLRASMQELVEHMAERLEPAEDGKPKVFKETTVGNLHEFIEMFDARNVTDDAELKALVDKAKGLLEGVDGTSIRSNFEIAEKMKAGMAELKTSLASMVIAKPTRKIRYDDEEGETAAAPTAAATA